MHKPYLHILFACLLCGIIVSADAADLALQRDLFHRLYPRAASGDLNAVQDEAQRLRDYPLYPYLEAADLDYQLQRKPGTALDTHLAAFLRGYPDLGVNDGLRARWLETLGERGEWQTLLDNYQPTDDAELRCYQLTARLRLDRTQDAAADARALWLNGKDQPDACTPVFDWMESQNLLTSALIEQRMNLAMDAGQTALVQHLSRKLPDSSQQRAARWRELQLRPVETLQKLASARDPEIDAALFDYGVRKAARTDALATSKLYPQLVRLYAPAPEPRRTQIAYIGLQMALDHEPESLDWYSQLTAAPDDQTAREWRIRCALYQGDWAMAKTWILELPAIEKADDRWRYWLARSLEAGGGQQSALQARQIFTELAARRGYYSYLAADRLGLPYKILNQPVATDSAIRQRLEAVPAALRARELHAQDLLPFARLEWRQVTTGLSATELQQAAVMARDWGWDQQAILTLAQSDYWDDLKLRYPLLYRDPTLAAARAESIDPAWVYGIMRSESLFQPDARSSAGALGLLQLLPGTGRLMSRRTGVPLASAEGLLVPATNLRLGAAYLHDMLERFGGQYSLATAAYNAGPVRVQQWIPARALPADVWVENIPFNETRGYVQRVLEHAVAFEWRLGRAITPLSKRMPAVNPQNLPAPGAAP